MSENLEKLKTFLTEQRTQCSQTAELANKAFEMVREWLDPLAQLGLVTTGNSASFTRGPEEGSFSRILLQFPDNGIIEARFYTKTPRGEEGRFDLRGIDTTRTSVQGDDPTYHFAWMNDRWCHVYKTGLNREISMASPLGQEYFYEILLRILRQESMVP